MLNRYGLFEVDTHLREIERRWHQSGSDEDKQTYIRVLRHAGNHHQADHLHMEPHVARYEEAAEASRKAQSASGRSGEQRRKETREARELAAQNMHEKAAGINRNAGEFIKKRKGGTPYQHVHNLADFHASHHYGARQFRNGEHQFQFLREPRIAALHAERFHKSLEHHYPHMKPRAQDWASGDVVRHKGAVRFRPGAWHDPHDTKDED